MPRSQARAPWSLLGETLGRSAAGARRGAPVPRDVGVLAENDVGGGSGCGDRVEDARQRLLAVARVEHDLELPDVVGLGHLRARERSGELLARLLVARSLSVVQQQQPNAFLGHAGQASAGGA